MRPSACVGCLRKGVRFRILQVVSQSPPWGYIGIIEAGGGNVGMRDYVGILFRDKGESNGKEDVNSDGNWAWVHPEYSRPIHKGYIWFGA